MIHQFPHIIDNTMRGAFTECPTKWRNSFLLNRAPAKPNVHLHAGACFASGLETTRRAFYDMGLPPLDAIGAGLIKLWEAYGTFEPDERDQQKGVWNVSKALVAYFERYKLGEDYLVPMKVAGNSLVEFTFALPIDVKHPDTNDPILYGGRFDMFAVHRGYGFTFIDDEKTSTQLGAQWIKQWDTAAQFTGYCWAGHKMGIPPVGAIVRGVGLLKTEITFAEAITYRDAWRIDRWYQQLCEDIEHMKWCVANDKFSKAEDHACSNYGGCSYTGICFHRDGDVRLMEEGEFAARNWNPLAKDPTEQHLGGGL